MAFIIIDYEEGSKKENLGYKSVIIYNRKNEKFVFDSGDFVKDWYNAKKKYVEMADDELYLRHSSSVDHFIMDGAKFDSAWLVFGSEGDNPQLEYKYSDKGWEMFVNKDTTPTWEELKAYVKQN